MEHRSYTDPDFSESVSVSDGKLSATFTVEVLGAIEREEYVFRGSAARVMVPRPTLRITNHSSYDDFTPLVIRKRPYSVDVVMYLERYEGVSRWSSDHNVYGSRGVRDDRGGRVGYTSATDKAIDGLVERARDAFVAANPEWETRSLIRRLERLIERANLKASDLRAEADGLDFKAFTLGTEVNGLRARLDRS